MEDSDGRYSGAFTTDKTYVSHNETLMSRLRLYSRSALHRRDHQRWPDLSRITAIELNLLTGIGLVTLVSSIAALMVCGLLIIDIASV